MRVKKANRAIELPIEFGPLTRGARDGWKRSFNIPEKWWEHEGYFVVDGNTLIVSQNVAEELLEQIPESQRPEPTEVTVWAPELPGWKDRPDDGDNIRTYHDGNVVVC